jgi:PKD repeat protein
MTRNRRVALVALCAIGLAAVVLPTQVGAQKVANPGAFSLASTGGQARIGGLTLDLTPNPLPQCSDGVDNDSDGRIDLVDPQCVAGPEGQPASADDNELVGGFQPKQDVSISGNIDKNGVVNIPIEGVKFPPYFVPININGLWIVRADVVATAPATGSIDPLTGLVNLTVKIQIKLSGNIGNQLAPTCAIGTTNNPITLNLTSGRMEPIGTNGALTGSPYNTATGRALLVENAFGVPGASGCTAGIFTVNDQINQQVGIPSGAGRNLMVLSGLTSPILDKGINPVITTNPSTIGGAAPQTIDFSADTSQVSAGPATYAWSFSDGTTATGANVSKTFSAGGQYTATLTATDADGDTATATRTFTLTAPTGSTTTTSSTTTSTTASTTTTQPTTTSTTTSTTTTQPTTTSTTTTTLVPTDDTVTVNISGLGDYQNAGNGLGDVTVDRDGFGIRRVQAIMDLTGKNGGTARFAVSAQRAWILPLWTGQVSLRDPGAGVDVAAPIFGQVSPGAAPGSAQGTATWFKLGQFPNLLRPFTVNWSVAEAG